MRVLLLHSDFIEFQPLKKALKSAPDLSEKEKKPRRYEEALVVFTSVEKGDEGKEEPVAKKAVEEIKSVVSQVHPERIVLYPFVHLSNEPSKPDTAIAVLDLMEKMLSSEFEVHRAPFGYYKTFTIKVKGHPLSELSRSITAESVEELEVEETMEKLSEETEDGVLEDLYVIMPDGRVLKREQVDDPGVEKAIKAELGEISEASFGKPPHLELMRRLEIADHEPISDAGNLRYYPNGAFIFELLAELGRKMSVDDLGGMVVKTPFIINPNDPGVHKMMEKFPERTYRVLPGSKEKNQEFRLRPACDYGVWSIFRDAVITYKNLPFGLYELDHFWRYEQRGELLGMYRLRSAVMSNYHEMTRDLNQAFERFLEHIDKFALALYRNIEIEPSVIVLNCKRDFYNAHLDVFKGWAQKLKIPIIVKLFKVMKTYKVAWIDVLAFDNLGRPMEIDTVQLDTESASWWGIHYIDENNQEKQPLILHTGFGFERTVAALLEHAYGSKQKGENPMLPLWLSPIQVRFIPIGEKHLEYALDLAKRANELGVRADVDDRDQSLGKRIRFAERNWIPYVVVIGDKEIETGDLSVRVRKTGEQKKMKLEDLVNEIHELTKGKPYKSSPFPLRLSRRPIFVASN